MRPMIAITHLVDTRLLPLVERHPALASTTLIAILGFLGSLAP